MLFKKKICYNSVSALSGTEFFVKKEEINVIIQSDWHIHSHNSYDATLSLEEISRRAKELEIKKTGITDHANFNDEKFLGDLNNSVNEIKEYMKSHPEFILGVELTPIEKPEFDYIEKNGTREGYIPPIQDKPYDIELARTKEQLKELGVRYAIGAAHWRVDVPNARSLPFDKDAIIREYYRQQMWLSCDERVTILGHPWGCIDDRLTKDFTVIPRSMNVDIAAALKANNKYVECNGSTLCAEKASEKYKRQYAEFLRELFEIGIPLTFGSDSHHVYGEVIEEAEKILAAAGFKEGDIAGVKDCDLW